MKLLLLCDNFSSLLPARGRQLSCSVSTSTSLLCLPVCCCNQRHTNVLRPLTGFFLGASMFPPLHRSHLYGSAHSALPVEKAKYHLDHAVESSKQADRRGIASFHGRNVHARTYSSRRCLPLKNTFTYLAFTGERKVRASEKRTCTQLPSGFTSFAEKKGRAKDFASVHLSR